MAVTGLSCSLTLKNAIVWIFGILFLADASVCCTLSWIQLITRTKKEAAFIYKTTPERPKPNRVTKSRMPVGQQGQKQNYNEIPAKAELCGAKPKKLRPPQRPCNAPPSPPTIHNYLMLFSEKKNESEVQFRCGATVGWLWFVFGNCLISEITGDVCKSKLK